MSKIPKTFETTTESYARKAQLGHGGAGSVFRVTNSDDAEYALKLLDSASPASVKPRRFRNEITACRAIHHESVIKIVDDGFAMMDGKKAPFYVMPLYAGTLRSAMQGGLDGDDVLVVFLQVLDGVEAAHLMGVCHRDLKPENILMQSEGKACVADFGIARITPELSATLIETGNSERLANFVYAAPEQRATGATVGPRADIYSLGLMLNEAFTGEVIQGTGPRTIGDANPRFGYLDPIVARMTAQNPAVRFATVEEVKREIVVRGDIEIAQQSLDAVRAETVPTHEWGKILPVRILGVEPRSGSLEFTLDRAPERDFVAFLQSVFSHSSVLGSEPSRLRFSGGTAVIPLVQDSDAAAQKVVDHVKEWFRIAERSVNSARERRAREAEEIERNELRTRIAEEERQIRLKKKLTW